MLKQSKNEVVIEGILNEVDLEVRKDKNDRTYISGKVFFLVQQTINGVEDIDIIPVNVFAYELKPASRIPLSRAPKICWIIINLLVL